MKLFDNLDKFIKAVEDQAKAAAKKGADILRTLADWLETQSTPQAMSAKPSKAKAKPSDLEDLDKLQEYVGKLETAAQQHSEKPVVMKATKAVGPGLAILLQVIIAAIQALLAKKQAEQQPAPTQGEAPKTGEENNPQE